MTLAEPPPTAPPGAAARVRAALRAAGIDEGGIADVLGARAPAGLGPAGLGRRLGGQDPRAILLRLFLAETSVPVGVVRTALGAETLDALRTCGLVRVAGGRVRPCVAIEPIGGLLVTYDRRSRHRAHTADYVLGPGPVTRRLADLAVPCPRGRVLDLGCGSGTLALLSAAAGATVTGVDVNPRAIAFARFNAALNALDDVELLVGDLFAPVAGRRFDRILCNPPYVVSPARTYTYRDAATDVCATIARDMPAHLAPGGVGQMLANWPCRHGQGCRETPAAWLPDDGADLLVLAGDGLDPVAYAETWLRQEHADDRVLANELDAWLAYYREQDIGWLGEGLVTVHRPVGRAPWREVRAMPETSGAAGASIGNLVAARDCLARCTDDASLLALRLMAPPGVELRERRRAGIDGWDAPVFEVVARRGLRLAVRVDAVGAAIVRRLDGHLTLAEAAAAVADRAGVDVSALTDGLPSLVRALMQVGLLIPREPIREPIIAAR
ncbi:MAG: methyltransferase [Ectothiorhodospiraceae bacterium]|nr:methyltransferase [Ectothiorhodospiraceae bacterium]